MTEEITIEMALAGEAEFKRRTGRSTLRPERMDMTEEKLSKGPTAPRRKPVDKGYDTSVIIQAARDGRLWQKTEGDLFWYVMTEDTPDGVLEITCDLSVMNTLLGTRLFMELGVPHLGAGPKTTKIVQRSLTHSRKALWNQHRKDDF